MISFSYKKVFKEQGAISIPPEEKSLIRDSILLDTRESRQKATVWIKFPGRSIPTPSSFVFQTELLIKDVIQGKFPG